ncbi:hypothetical protein SAMN04488040_3513 [Sulfitobacter marinus]|uniref:Methyltransferase domain-containing protein n=1 Tax=Sulfitobacter marinus TaxID=394264 RepID=A0A1I6VRF7_9RHOB|nr:class I SAM-dependent methyltransferase [Sulfitobacter marinus]SFT16267.1 hypothetical protein SAMN04488040_3513 [Sulfitobacter marinus]
MGLRTFIAKSVEKKLAPRFNSIEDRLLQYEEDRLLQYEKESDPKLGDEGSHPLVQSRDDDRFFRENLVQTLGKKGLCLEIGAYFRPIITGENARYFDVFDAQELRERAKRDPDPNVTEHSVPDIHYTDPDGDISIIKETFTDVVTSHCIEHQPDLIAHLEKIYDLLEDGGRYVAIVPDKRYCFDHFSPVTSLGNVLEASFEQRERHSLSSIVNLYGTSTHNDPTRHWRGDHFDEGYHATITQRAQHALTLYGPSNGSYVDCHAWCFTPDSFAQICSTLYQMKKIRLRLEAVGDTRVNTLEFSAIFRRD